MGTPRLSKFLPPACCALFALLAASACNVGGGGGGGPSDRPLPARALVLPKPNADPVLRGAQVYERQGCRLCHGEAGKGGVSNPNSETAGKINGLTLVKEGYSKDELVKKIEEGQQEVGKDNKQGATPPLRMPVYGAWLSKQQLSDLAEYLLSLYPKGAAAADDDWGSDDSKGKAKGKGSADEKDDEADDEEEADAKAPAHKAKASHDGGAIKAAGDGGHK